MAWIALTTRLMRAISSWLDTPQDAGQVRGELLLELHAALEDLVVAQLEAALDELVDVEADGLLLLGGPAEGEQALGQAS